MKDRRYKHGLTDKHRLYSTWKSMRSRCNNPNDSSYSYYGAKGVYVCERWDNFLLFVEDMEASHREGLTLDREDNSGPYSPKNCKWSTHIEQTTNQDKSLRLNYKGSIVTEAELSRLTGVPRTTIQSRRRKGWSVKEMINGK